MRAVVLFTLGGLFSIYEGYHKIYDPHDLDSPAIAIGILPSPPSSRPSRSAPP